MSVICQLSYPVSSFSVDTILSRLPASAYSAMIVDLSATASNYNLLRSRSKKSTCSAVLKADAYGVGAGPVALTTYQEGCRDYFVAYTDEGVKLRQTFLDHGLFDPRIFVLNGFFPGIESTFFEYDLIPVLTDLDQVTRRQMQAHFVGRSLPMALHLDTGMTRTGLPEKEIRVLSQTPQMLNGLDLKLVLTQMVYSDRENITYTYDQQKIFDERRSWLPPVPASFSKSGGIFLDSSFHYQMVRPGIALHGVTPQEGLQPVVSLYARVCQIQTLEAGGSVGYCQSYKAPQLRRIATLSVGYADGYPWNLCNMGHVWFSGYQAPIVGRISMDLITVDVTDIPELFVGEWAELVGRHLSIEDFATQAKTVPYEILLRIGQRFQRIYRKEGVV